MVWHLVFSVVRCLVGKLGANVSFATGAARTRGSSPSTWAGIGKSLPVG
ncbi:hypothetical protein OCO_45690 [Mycobacterium intracellulare MOTT-02]|nr:hypothetical protein OCO_45690 [Mycobacterium intracellulare MOTT-02]ARR80179.1 hypothetical protein MOTT12_04515 [Mycobacterium intracellulare subsp. yongonense]ARR85247.1 hypothetical protein MOTT27_04426 [Mycobacterium intracellulare subsp. yongonense]